MALTVSLVFIMNDEQEIHVVVLTATSPSQQTMVTCLCYSYKLIYSVPVLVVKSKIDAGMCLFKESISAVDVPCAENALSSLRLNMFF